MSPLVPSLDTDHLATLGLLLLAWYERNQRPLPWRSQKDPYAVWVAEIMLQQTRTETVIPYYERFLVRFPRLTDLAAAPVEAVLKAWEGLGYYARARNLHKAAVQVVQQMHGNIPCSAGLLEQLPGVGRYTAAAIASIAFGQDVVALDGNLQRVLCRLLAVDDDPGHPSVRRRLEAAALTTMPPGRAGDLNQALMDLGASICLPIRPRCPICPVAHLCQGRQAGIQDSLPIRATRTHRPHRDVTAGVIWDKAGRFLITQRPFDAMLGGMWEFPGGKRHPGENLDACLQREITEELDIRIQVQDLLCKVDHSFTHFHMTLYAFNCTWLSGAPRCLGCAGLHWATLDDLDSFAFPVADQKIIAALRNRPTSAG